MADLSNEMPAVNYRANNLAELDEKRYTTTQRIYLPITPTNQKIFGFADISDVVAVAPYKKMPCRLLCNGTNIIGDESIIMLHCVSSSFECQVIGGLRNFIVGLNKVRFYDEEDGQIDGNRYPASPLWHYRRRANIPTSPIISDIGGFGTQSGYGIFSSRTGSKYAYPLFGYTESATVPYVKFIPFLKMLLIFSTYDKKYEINLECDIDGIDQIATLATGMKITESGPESRWIDSLESFKAYAQQKTGNVIDNRFEWAVPNSGNGFLTVSDGSKVLTYKAPFDGSVIFRFWADGSGVNAVADIKNITTGESWSSGFYLEHMEGGRVAVPLTKDNIIQIEATGTRTGSSMGIIEIEKITKSDGIVPVDGDVEIFPNMGFSNASAYLQNMMQALGLFIHYDGKNKILHLGNASTIYKNRSKAKDWSKKLNNKKYPEVNFSIPGYAQRNTISFKEDKNSAYQDTVSLEVKNESLDDSKELFKLEFESGVNDDTYSNWNNGSINIAAHTSLFDSTGYIGSGVPRIVVVDESIYVTMSNQRYPLVRHLRGDELIDKAYRGMVDGLLKNAKVITVEFFLTEDDVENINQLIPIYVSKFGKYYYVNKIKNYVYGRPTECELIEL